MNVFWIYSTVDLIYKIYTILYKIVLLECCIAFSEWLWLDIQRCITLRYPYSHLLKNLFKGLMLCLHLNQDAYVKTFVWIKGKENECLILPPPLKKMNTVWHWVTLSAKGWKKNVNQRLLGVTIWSCFSLLVMQVFVL